MSEAAPTLTGATVPKLPKGVRLHHDETRAQWLLMGPERLFKLDPIALEILRRCDGATDLATMIGDLARQFEADAATVDKDVRAFLGELVARGMVVLT